MRNTTKITTAVLAAGALALGLSACASNPTQKDGENDALVVAASPVPHADILKFVKDNLAEKAGLKLEVKEFDDYVIPNTATENGEVGANFFQHKPYLDDFNAKNKTHIVPVVNVELEPLGLYPGKAKTLAEIKAGDTIAVPSDTTNQGRALQLIASKGLITLKPGVGANASLQDIADSKGLKFKDAKAELLPSQLPDVAAAVINGNVALGAKLDPAKGTLALEKAEGNPYANFLAVKDGKQNDPRVVKLVKLLNSPEVKKFIETKYHGSVVPAFGKPAA